MDSRKTSALRTRLRDVDVEYSALVRNKSREGRSVRMAQLRNERAALITLLSGAGELILVTPSQTALNASDQLSA
jgi:hypothetical protein